MKKKKLLLWILIMSKSYKIFIGLLVFSIFSSLAPLFAEGKSALQLKQEALNQESIQDSIEYVKSNLPNCSTKADTRSLLTFLASLQEQLGLYTDASYSYAKAAGIAAKDAEGMEKVSSEQLVIRAVRCALNSGDWERAETYLNSAVRSSTDKEILAYVNLYGVWASLCKVQSVEEAKDPIALLNAYVDMDSMLPVKSQLLFTLWYVTGKNEYASSLQRDFPNGPETSIVQGKSKMASVPFWYFLPRVSHDSAAFSEKKATSAVTAKKLQVGFFGVKANADELIEKLSKKGFSSYIRSEKRSSGKTYYAVLVDDTDGSMEKKLKSAGFDCYPVK